MSDAVNCEYCVNYSYDDDYECYKIGRAHV